MELRKLWYKEAKNGNTCNDGSGVMNYFDSRYLGANDSIPFQSLNNRKNKE